MNQSQLDRAVARATGETLGTISHLGFSIADPKSARYDPEPSRRPPQVVDWDALDARRRQWHRSRAVLDKNQDHGECMGELIVLGILIGVAAWIYKAGKREGSRKGFHVGRSQRRFRR